jgi:hypothetical protein
MASQTLRNPQSPKQPMPAKLQMTTGSGRIVNPIDGKGSGKVINGMEKATKKGGK